MKQNFSFLKNKKYGTTLLFLFCLIQLHAQTYSWKQRADFPNAKRQGAIGFSIDSLGYIGGGYTDFNNLNDFWQYHPKTNTWERKADLPFPIRTAMTFVIGGKAYLTGGIITGAPFNNKLWMYDPLTDIWTEKAPYPGTGIYGGVGFAIGTKGYIGVGNSSGADGPYLNDFYEYDSANDTWQKKKDFPEPARYGGYGIALNGKGYVGLGYDNNTLIKIQRLVGI